jgi:hypothetical protein
MPKHPAFKSGKARAKAEPVSDVSDNEEEAEEMNEKDDAGNEYRPKEIEDIQFGAWYDKVPTLPPLTEREIKLENRKQERLRKKKARKGPITADEVKSSVEMQIAVLATKLAQAEAAYEERAAEHFKASTSPP